MFETIVFVSQCQVLKARLDEGVGRLVGQIPNRSGALLPKFLVQHG
jgi:hypothetical protein